LLEVLLEDVEQRFALGGKADALLAALLGIIFDRRTGGGVAGLMARFRVQGLGDVFAAWLDNPRAKAIEPRQLEKMFGAAATTTIARRLGLPRETALAALCVLLPRLIAALTRNGALPTSVPADVRAYLDRSEPVPARPDGERPHAQVTDFAPRLASFKWVLPAALLVALGFFVLHGGTRGQETVTATPTTVVDIPRDTPR